jgi:alpha-galactosidase
MDRRTFVLLTGGVSGGLLRPPRRRIAQSAGLGRLKFELDEERRWSLWYYGDGPPLPLIKAAVVGARVGDQWVTLADLQDSTVGTRKPPGGEAVVVRGRAAGVFLEAEFLSANEAEGAAVRAAVSVTIYPDRYLPTVQGIRFFQAPEAAVLPGDAPLVALVNGYHSWSACRVAPVSAAPEDGLVSHGALGLTRGSRALALAFDPGEPGDATVRLSREGLEAGSAWLPTRPLRPEGDTSRMRLCFQPSGDGLDALTALFVPSSPVDRERLASETAPAGWCSWYELLGNVSESDVIANLEYCAANFDRRFFRYIQLDDGYQKATGDWDTNAKFPRGHHWLTDQIHAKGFKAGLWVAPFAVTERSGVPAAHPDWLLRRADVPIVWDTRDDWGGKVYSLDGAHPQVQQWLFDLARRAVKDWGYDYLKIDFLLWATAGDAHYGGLTHAEAYRKGLGAIRDGMGTETFLLGCGAPLQHAVGYVNGMRIGTDVDASWGGIQAPARAAALRSFYHRAAWLNDPDCLVVRPPLSPAEAQVWTAIVALCGGVTVLSDNLPKLPPDRLALLVRAIPTAPVAGRPRGTATVAREVAPAIVTGDDVYAIAGPWRLRTGDDPRYATREFDEDTWETVAVPKPWEEAGHPDYDGYAWYRTRFSLPPLAPGRTGGRADSRTPYLELGKVDDVDETFLNGVKLGQTGAFPPNYRSEWQAYRRYRVPVDALNWGGENVLAVRVYDGGGAGGIWSVRRDPPPAHWVVEGAPRWWTVALINWEDEPRQLSVPLGTLGISGAKFDAYDVWRDAPLVVPKDVLAAALEPHSTLTVALRAATAHPQVIGTTRHIVQGAVDIADETWDAGARTLKARSVNLDCRAYAVTVSVPKGIRPGTCKADVPCTVKRLESGHAVLEWAAGGDGRDMHWELSFRSTTARKGKG